MTGPLSLCSLKVITAETVEFGHLVIKIYVLIVLTQPGTRCGHSPGKARKQLSAYTTVVETEAEFVQIGLVTLAAAMISTENKCLEVADCRV